MQAFIDMTGQRFGYLTAVSFIGAHRSLWRCVCDCGAVRAVSGYRLRSGRLRSCGCRHSELQSRAQTTHGESNSPTAELRIWRHMHTRCFNPRNPAYKNYGGRGITVCERWRGKDGYLNFLADMGRRPSGDYSIDRINNNGNYEPGNCRWATRKEQRANRRPRTHCNNGHPWTPETTVPCCDHLTCKICRDARRAKRNIQRKEAPRRNQ